MNILVLGDVVGPSGVKAVTEKLPGLIKEKKIDFVVINGENIYRKKLKFSQIKRRVENSYFPYHHALQRLIENTRIKFGFCI